MTGTTDHPRPEERRGGLWQVVLLDIGPAVVLALIFGLTRKFDREIPDALILLFVILPILARRFWPVAVLAVVAFGAVLTSAGSGAPYTQVAAVALASFTVGDLA